MLSTHQIKNKKLFFIGNGLIATFYAVYGYLCAMLFYRQSVVYNGNYHSDLVAHITMGINGQEYSLMEYILGFIAKRIGNYKVIGIYLSVLVLLTIFITWRLMRMLAPDVDPVLLHIGAILSNLAMAIYIPALNPYRYLGVQSGNIYHNSTYIGMKLAGTMVLFLYFKYDKKYEKGLTFEEWILFAESIILVNLMKPNFFVAFAPLMGLWLLYDLIKKKGKTFPKIFMFGLAVIPSVLILLLTYVRLFPGDSATGSIVIDPGFALGLRTNHPMAAVIQTMAFPFFVLAFHIRDLKKEKTFAFSWSMLLISFSEYFLLAETGTRRNDGNLSWGYCYGIFLVFVVSITKLWQDWHCRKNYPKWYFAVALLLLAAHIFFGLQYFAGILQGGSIS